MHIRILMTLALLIVPVTAYTQDRPTWDDGSQHIRIVASYDGRRIRVVSAVLGQGAARSYLSQRRDVVVVILNSNNEVLREFNLPDPLEIRVRERPRTGEPIGRPPGRNPPIARTGESTVRQRRTQFELFIPRLDGAKLLEFHQGSARGRLLGRLDLTEVQ